MLHQRGAGSTDAPVATTPGGYGGPPPPAGITCARSIVEGAITMTSGMGEQGTSSLPLSSAVVPVDLAESPDLHEMAIAAPGNTFTPGAQTVLVFDPASLFAFSTNGCAFPKVTPQPAGQPIALADRTQGTTAQLVVQTREPAALFLPDSLTTIRLSNDSREDTGHDIFHSNSGGNIACASCHPEGGDDGRVWSFDKLGQRRTPSLRGTVQGTAPYHWGGEMQDFPTLVADVFQSRMSGPVLADDQTAALSGWVNRIPAPVAPAPLDPASAARGKTLFEGSASCSSCHGGAKLTNNASVDVGTGQAFQVPSLLGVGYREPFMHDGCASTLKDRFDGTCGGDLHGTILGLSDQDRSDIVAYLQTL
jgi:cytochrome c